MIGASTSTRQTTADIVNTATEAASTQVLNIHTTINMKHSKIGQGEGHTSAYLYVELL